MRRFNRFIIFSFSWSALHQPLKMLLKVIKMPINNINELPLAHEIYSKLVVELGAQDSTKDAVLSAIIKILGELELKRIPNPKGVLNTLCDYKEFDLIEDGDMIRFVFDEETTEKGGEKMNYTPKVTSGEAKVAEAILDYLGAGLTPQGVNKETFEEVLKNKLHKINKRAKPHLALRVMIRGGYLQEKEGKIFLGEKGEKYLSP